jgi:hypothetical protein
VALDAWTIALEQYVLAEAFFGLLIALAVWASIAAKPGSRDIALAFAGLCFAAAALMRPIALFAVPAWLLWMLWTRPGKRPVAAGVAALVVPLLVYSLAHAHTTGTFGLTQSEGWFLYGRVGSIAKCDGISVDRASRKLCDRPARAAHEGQSFFMFNRQSPARKAFGGISASSRKQKRTNAELRHFAVQVIEHRPLKYAGLVGGDFLRWFRPGPRARYREDQTVEFPSGARIRFDDRKTRHRLFPGLKAHAGAPAEALRSYGTVVHTSRPLIALFALAGLVLLVLRRRDPRAPALFLALGTAVFMLVGAAATAGFALRYLVPEVAEWAMTGTLCLELLASLAAGRGIRSAPLTPPRGSDRR